jgi:hypothetical protein
MDTYYTRAGKVLGRAWSTMRCRDADAKVEHKPHSHNPEHAMYGPYMCGGYPKVDLYNTKPRKPVN